MKDHTAPETVYATLAAVWVEQWLKHGGYLIVDGNCDNLSIGMRLDWRHKPSSDEALMQKQRLWHDGWTVGRWRMLSDLCKELTGLRAAIIDHVAESAQRVDSDGSRWMMAA